MQQRCRLHFESLRNDPTVEFVRFEKPTETPSIRLLHVAFREGYTQPRNPSLRYLNLQFNNSFGDVLDRNASSINTVQIRMPEASEVQETLNELRVVMATFPRQPPEKPKYALSAEYNHNDERTCIPPWGQPGDWVKEKTSERMCLVMSATLTPTVFITLQEWRTDRPFTLTIESFKEQFQLGAKPKDPETWHRRLMGEDDF